VEAGDKVGVEGTGMDDKGSSEAMTASGSELEDANMSVLGHDVTMMRSK
jgi:hypothetical protein